MNDQHVGHRNRLGYRRKVLQRVVAQGGNHRREDGERRNAHEQGVSVGWAFRDDLVADRRSRTRTVFHDHLLRQCFRQFLREHAVRPATGR